MFQQKANSFSYLFTDTIYENKMVIFPNSKTTF